MKYITSKKNNIFKQLVKLDESPKNRKISGLTILDGIHLINFYYEKIGLPECLFINESGLKNPEVIGLISLVQNTAVKIYILNDKLFCSISPVKTPTGVIALIRIPALNNIILNKKKNFSVLLESIQDPGNLGSILRSAAAAGASDIYMSPDCADAWSPKVLRAAMGAHFLLHIYERSKLIEISKEFKGAVIATTVKHVKSLYALSLQGPVAFMFGNEGTGLSKMLYQTANEKINIPMPGKTNSLNVASTAAICFFERVRQLQ
tara:strand:- start:7558 stop:8346 length:789 start_codon:yes stop_codon:yes gene_type:complete